MSSQLGQCMFPSAIASAEPARKNLGRTVIAHISDLHFRSDTDFNNQPWNALVADLSDKDRPPVDVLVVTGDLIDAPLTLKRHLPAGLVETETSRAFKRVAQYLDLLCKNLSIKPEEGLFVVPGNHDYRAIGIYKSRRQPLEFYQHFKDYCRPLLLPSLNICVFVLDSNIMEFGDLAAARVGTDDLVAFYTLASNVQVPNLTRIALLHHHPMPIPETEKAGIINHPGFTLLKNAGQCMSTMVAAKIDLILHGHEHHAAYSKAMFPFDNDREHFMTVVSAGSVGKGIGNYNVISISDDGQIDLERRSHNNRALYQQEYVKKLRNYETARRALFEASAVAEDVLFHAERITRLFHIKGGSGDAILYERADNVRANSQTVEEFPFPLKAPGGFFFTPEFDNPHVTWIWDNRKTPDRNENASAADNADREERKGRLVFNPPLTKDKPISFGRLHKFFNLFQFNQQDKRDVTRDSEDEQYSLSFKNAIEFFTATLLFPEGNFPEHFEFSVRNRRGEEDPFETEYFSKRISLFRQARTVTYSLETPLPGYRYTIRWKLPSLEQDEMNLSGSDRARGNLLVTRLLKAREGGQYEKVVRDWINGLRLMITASNSWIEPDLNDDLEISLYVDDRYQGGLACVATSPEHNKFAEPWPGIIKPGKTFIGAAYRRRQPLSYNPLAGKVFDAEEYQVRIPEGWKSSPGCEPEYIANCAIPLSYPKGKGRRVAVVSFASKNPLSRLLSLLPDKNDDLVVKQRKSARQQDLIQQVLEQQSDLLVSALGIPVGKPAAKPRA